MKLKGKQVEAFVKALDESEKMNRVKENNEVNKSNINDAELEKLKEIIQKQGALKVNPKLVKECDVTTEWVKEDESDDEEEVPVSVVDVIKKCDCGG